MAYSAHYRKKVLAYRAKHRTTIKATAEHFKIGTASVTRWVYKQAPCKNRNKQPLKIKAEELIADVEKYPDAFQYERAKRLGVSVAGIYHALKRLKISYKKNSATSKSRRRGTYKIQR
jgi:transposase